MDRLFMDLPGARRRFVDRLALAIAPAHATHAARAEAAVRERNRLLPPARPRSALDGYIEEIEAAAISAGPRR
jgi:DNA replication and repair protein RecF